MHVTMVKKRLADGSECRKCIDVSSLLSSRDLWSRVDEVVWALEDDPTSPGMILGQTFAVDAAPFFIVRENNGTETVYVSVLQLIRDRLHEPTTAADLAEVVDVDDIGGI